MCYIVCRSKFVLSLPVWFLSVHMHNYAKTNVSYKLLILHQVGDDLSGIFLNRCLAISQ